MSLLQCLPIAHTIVSQTVMETATNYASISAAAQWNIIGHFVIVIVIISYSKSHRTMVNLMPYHHHSILNANVCENWKTKCLSWASQCSCSRHSQVARKRSHDHQIMSKQNKLIRKNVSARVERWMTKIKMRIITTHSISGCVIFIIRDVYFFFLILLCVCQRLILHQSTLLRR